MTDTAPAVEGGEVGDPRAVIRVCQWPEGCSKTIPSAAHPNTKYCGEHSLEARKIRRSSAATGQQPGPASNPSGAGPGKLGKELANQLYQAGMLLMLVEQFDGAAVMSGAESLATALESLARTNPGVRRFLESTITATGWFGVIAAVGGIVVPIAAHHGVLPPAFIPPALRNFDQRAPAPPADTPPAPGPAVVNGQTAQP